MEEDKLISQMEYARYEHETEMLRERNIAIQFVHFLVLPTFSNFYNFIIYCIELRQREQDRERQKRDWEMKERQREESRLREEESLRRQQDEMQHRLRQQEEEMRRRQQENNMFLQEQNPEQNSPDFRRPLQPPPIFDRPIGMNAASLPHNLMDLPMVCQTLSFLYLCSVKRHYFIFILDGC